MKTSEIPPARYVKVDGVDLGMETERGRHGSFPSVKGRIAVPAEPYYQEFSFDVPLTPDEREELAALLQRVCSRIAAMFKE